MSDTLKEFLHHFQRIPERVIDSLGSHRDKRGNVEPSLLSNETIRRQRLGLETTNHKYQVTANRPLSTSFL